MAGGVCRRDLSAFSIRRRDGADPTVVRIGAESESTDLADGKYLRRAINVLESRRLLRFTCPGKKGLTFPAASRIDMII